MARPSCVLILISLLIAPTHAQLPVSFSDPALRAAVEAELWVFDPTPMDMLGLTSLNASAGGIQSLTGLEYARNLTTLAMTHNQISDLTPLAGLSNLRSLALNTNEIVDLSPLSGLSSLRSLNLHANRIRDISALSGLPHLETLIVRSNQIGDISTLDGLPRLVTLNLEDNRIIDISGVAGLTSLRELSLGFNQISDLAPVQGLGDLQYLDVHNNQVADISPLTDLHALVQLDLRNNPLSPDAFDFSIPRIRANNPGVFIEHDLHGQRVLSLSSTAGGSVIDPGEGEFRYDHDAYLRVEARAHSGFIFAGWSGNYSGARNPLWISLSGDTQIRAMFVSLQDELYVDDDAPGDPGPGDARTSDPQENGSPQHPFDRIQEGIDVAAEGASVIVRPGTYRENISLLGKNIHVAAVDLANPHGGPCATIEGTGGGPVVQIPTGGGSACSLIGFVITRGVGGGVGAIDCTGSSPTLANCLIVGNRCTDPDGAALRFRDSQAVLANCTIADNYAGPEGAAVTLIDSDIVVTDSILWGNASQEIRSTGASAPSIRYCAVAGSWPDLGNIDSDPLFAKRGVWTDGDNPGVGTEDLASILASQGPGVSWAAGDYHLMSQAGRWDPAVRIWQYDGVTSLCIDGGSNDSPIGHEPPPNGGVANMGVYGGTTEASKSPPILTP